MRNIRNITLCLLCMCTTLLSAQSIDDLRLRVRLYNLSRYTPQSTIVLAHTLANNGQTAIAAPLNADISMHISYTITDAHARVLTPLRPVIEPINNSREITLSPGESILFQDTISSDYRFYSGSFQLAAEFIINSGGQEYRIASAPLLFNVYDSVPGTQSSSNGNAILDAQSNSSTLDGIPMPESRNTLSDDIIGSTAANNQPQNTPDSLLPDRVVRSALNALQSAEWAQLYTHLDLASLYRESPQRNQRYINSSIDVQQQLLTQFANSIRSQNSVQLRIPIEYDIVRTEYNDMLATTYAVLTFAENGRRTTADFEYRMRKERRQWKIYHISATRNR